jgi:hypothetical protein
VNFGEIARKKFIGVPVIYWGLVVAGVLAFFAYKTKGAPTGDKTQGSPDSESDVTDNDAMDSLRTDGTVVVQPTPTPVANVIEPTNNKWLASAVDYIVNTKKLATVGDAQSALTKYLNGDDLTYFEGTLRDAAVTKLGLPPEGVAKVGQTANKPAQKQFSVFPGVHKVKSDNDDTPIKLAQLYYGTGDLPHSVKILEYNTQLGTSPNSVYSVGTSVNIPEYKVVSWYTVTGKNNDQYISTIAAKYGLTSQQIVALNPGISQPINKGYKVRVS